VDQRAGQEERKKADEVGFPCVESPGGWWPITCSRSLQGFERLDTCAWPCLHFRRSSKRGVKSAAFSAFTTWVPTRKMQGLPLLSPHHALGACGESSPPHAPPLSPVTATAAVKDRGEEGSLKWGMGFLGEVRLSQHPAGGITRAMWRLAIWEIVTLISAWCYGAT